MLRNGSVLLVITLFLSCSEDQETLKPTVGPITESVYASGVVKAAGQYDVYPTVSGTVTALLVQAGDTVKAGQQLLHIDDRTSGLAFSNAEAQLRLLEVNASESGPMLGQLKEALGQAREKLQLDSLNFARQQALWEQRIGSQAELDQRELLYTTSKANYNRALKALEEGRNRLRAETQVARNTASMTGAGNDDRTPRSLIDGVVYDVRIEPGELATPQRPVAVIGSATDLYLELEVDEADITAVKLGQRVWVDMDSNEGTTFEAKVTRIVPIMDERSRTFTVEAHFTTKPAALFPNVTAEASIVLRTKDSALTIPASYLVDGSFVLTAPEERTAVELGARDLERVEVLRGIDSTTVLYKP